MKLAARSSRVIDAPTEYIEDIYGGAPFEILEALRIHVPDDTATVLVVGHEPGMPATALTLDPDGEIDRFPTSAYAIVDVSVPWSRIGFEPGGGTLRAMRIPRV